MTGGINGTWARLIVEELVRLGVDTFCLASGFRSAPLAIAAAQHPRARVISHYDERGTAFFALGFARATGRAAVWITTSGTAVANGLPAVVEADADYVPMVLLTADRPPELRRTGANQTIDQAGIFARYVRWSCDMPAPDEAVPPAYVLTTVDQACCKAHSAPQGPVHLNCMFRAPLARKTAVSATYLAPVQLWEASAHPFTQYVPLRGASDAEHIAAQLAGASRILMVVGRLSNNRDGTAALDLAKACRWPVFADVNSQVRLGPQPEVLIDAYDLCLENTTFADAHAPEAVLYLGAPAVSKNLMRLLARHRPDPFVVVHDAPDRLDPTHQVTGRMQQSVQAACRSLQAAMGTAAGFDETWLKAWQKANRYARKVLEEELTGPGTLSEPFVAMAVTRRIADGHGLVLGNSLPVRDADRFGSAGWCRVHVAANRGASGIDGTIATAAGAACGWDTPVTVLLGDLSLLHDVNSLAMARSYPLTVVVINNNGGGIFHHVDIDTSPGTFERCFGTPHGLQFAHAAALFGHRYAQVYSRKEFLEVYSGACTGGESVIIEVCTDRKENHALRLALAGGMTQTG